MPVKLELSREAFEIQVEEESVDFDQFRKYIALLMESLAEFANSTDITGS